MAQQDRPFKDAWKPEDEILNKYPGCFATHDPKITPSKSGKAKMFDFIIIDGNTRLERTRHQGMYIKSLYGNGQQTFVSVDSKEDFKAANPRS